MLVIRNGFMAANRNPKVELRAIAHQPTEKNEPNARKKCPKKI